MRKEDIPSTFLRHSPAYKSKPPHVSEPEGVCQSRLSHSLQMHWTLGSIYMGPYPLRMGMGLCYNQFGKLEFV